MNYQDIHLEDKALWNQLQTAWEQDDYTTALNVLKNASLADKQLNAAVINALTTELLRLQSQADTGFKQDKIAVSAEPPADLADGEVYFRLIGPATEFDTDSYYIQFTQKSGSNYVDLNPATKATDTMLTPSVAQQYFKRQDVSLDEGIATIGNTIASLRIMTVKVYGPNNQLVENAQVKGLDGDPLTNSNGVAAGSLKSYSLTIIPSYIDWQPKTVDVSTVTTTAITVRLEKYTENTILRFTESQKVVFSSNIKNVDVCCVGGGGGGGYPTTTKYGYLEALPGGGGGGIVNSDAISITPISKAYDLVIGAGGKFNTSGIGSGLDGGATSFATVTAPGGKGANTQTSKGGDPGVIGCGTGGDPEKTGVSNTTVSEFNDGATFYSGGGAGGNIRKTTPTTTTRLAGGSPNGADGAYLPDSGFDPNLNATQAGIGGGGGGGFYYGYQSGQKRYGYPSAGGSGLVAIKLHYN